MFKQIKFSNAVAIVLVDTEEIDSMAKLARITTTRASKLAKAICSPGGGAGAGTLVTEGAEQNNDAARVSRTLPCDKVLKPDSSKFEEHETQRLM